MTLPNSSHYEWHQLNDGILAAVMKPDGNKSPNRPDIGFLSLHA